MALSFRTLKPIPSRTESAVSEDDAQSAKRNVAQHLSPAPAHALPGRPASAPLPTFRSVRRPEEDPFVVSRKGPGQARPFPVPAFLRNASKGRPATAEELLAMNRERFGPVNMTRHKH